MSLVPPWRGAEGADVLLRRSVPRCHDRDLPTFATKHRATTAACVQRSCCRMAKAVLASAPQRSTITLRPVTNQPYERPMKQFPTTQEASMPRTAAVISLRPFCAELLS